jgi:hypothetical protein
MRSAREQACQRQLNWSDLNTIQVDLTRKYTMTCFFHLELGGTRPACVGWYVDASCSTAPFLVPSSTSRDIIDRHTSLLTTEPPVAPCSVFSNEPFHSRARVSLCPSGFRPSSLHLSSIAARRPISSPSTLQLQTPALEPIILILTLTSSARCPLAVTALGDARRAAAPQPQLRASSLWPGRKPYLLIMTSSPAIDVLASKFSEFETQEHPAFPSSVHTPRRHRMAARQSLGPQSRLHFLASRTCRWSRLECIGLLNDRGFARVQSRFPG